AATSLRPWLSTYSRCQRAESEGAEYESCASQSVFQCSDDVGLPSRSPRKRAKAGGAGRDRTDDLKLAKLALSQLSYGPLPVHEWPAEPKLAGHKQSAFAKATRDIL